MIIEPALTPRCTEYVCNYSGKLAPILYVEAVPTMAEDGAHVTITDGTNTFHDGDTQIPAQSSRWIWRYPYVPSAGGTVVFAIATTYDGITKDYTLTFNFTKTA